MIPLESSITEIESSVKSLTRMYIGNRQNASSKPPSNLNKKYGPIQTYRPRALPCWN